MHKKTFRWISTLLTLAILIQLSPTAFFSALVQSADASNPAVSAGQYEYDVPQAGSGIVESEHSDTFSDDGQRSILGRITLPEQTEDDSEYFDLISNCSHYSDLSSDSAAFLCQYVGASDSDFTVLEQSGFSIMESVAYIDLAIGFGYSLSAITAAALSEEEVRELSAQIYLYNNAISDSISPELDAELREKIFSGYSCEQVFNSYGASQVHSMDMDLLLSSSGDLSSLGLTSEDAEQVQSFSTTLGISAFAVANYAMQNDISISDITSSISQIEVAVSEIAAGSAAVPSSPSETTDSLPFPAVVSAPYIYSSAEYESLNLNTGSLIYESTDYVLPGVNGLDLVIARRYDSQAASIYTPKTDAVLYTQCAYFVSYTAIAYYYVPGIGEGRWRYYDTAGEFGPYIYYSDAYNLREMLEGRHRIENFSDGADLIYEISCTITLKEIDYAYRYRSSTEENNFLNDTYGLGNGWSLQFSSVRVSDSAEVLYLSDGSAYEVDWSTNNPSHLKGYEQEDKIFERNITEFSSGNVNAQYRLTYQDGKREYFSSDGKLIGICDRYGNSIKFEYSTLNGYPHIKVTDSIGRVVNIVGEDTPTGHKMTVVLPDNSEIVYHVRHSEEYDNAWALASVDNLEGTATQYEYTLCPIRFNGLPVSDERCGQFG